MGDNLADNIFKSLFEKKSYLYESEIKILDKEFKKLRSQNERYRAALESVADLSQQDSIKEIYWRLVSHGNCAEVLAEDVKICREALKEVDDK